MLKELNSLNDWIEIERKADNNWINNNIKFLSLYAESKFLDYGRGLVIINTLIEQENLGYPFGYILIEEIDKSGNKINFHVAKNYDPKNEIALLLLKLYARESIYIINTKNIFP